ncbi:hypothetical protein B0T25DRAFT_581071 [Lasiosphaeria hispida]|uniref:Fucose-specific lectin n=1 Tax=Lasiosphaeria hispida TaxID=260671 RepID=A0AAJ0HIG1_9PEZI|nr:hypothetical protein B0T25DRAFT_581071 [Lasiosphaeria hispida]
MSVSGRIERQNFDADIKGSFVPYYSQFSGPVSVTVTLGQVLFAGTLAFSHLPKPTKRFCSPGPVLYPITATSFFHKRYKNVLVVYFGLDGAIAEVMNIEGAWRLTTWVAAPGVSTATRLAVANCPGNGQVHLFYTTTRNTIGLRVFTLGTGWSPGRLDVQGEAPVIPPWSALSALHSPRSLRLYYQRDDDVICEISRETASTEWVRTELGRAARGTSITSVWYPGKESPVYLVYFQGEDGRLCGYRHDGEGGEISELPLVDVPLRAPLSAVAWWCSGRASVRLFYISAGGEVCGLSWLDDQGWTRSYRIERSDGESIGRGGQIAALQMGRGDKIRIYLYDSSRSTLDEIGFSKTRRKPMVNTIWHR